VQTAAGNHAPGFTVDERALPVGVRALSHLAVDFLQSP
jgi:metal-dependent amidase/aminoacylase/carboxypeptidase family protein